MPSSFTEHYNLSQWERTDKVQMEDFKGDNAKIDAAIKAEADTRAGAVAALTAQVASKGNCQVYTATYVGDGVANSSTGSRHTFPGKPLLVVISQVGGEAALFAPADMTDCSYFRGASIYGTNISWSGNTLNWQPINNGYNMFNIKGITYRILALIALD